MKQSKKRDRRGFTLVEIIVVLVILAILAAILIPTYINYINKTDEKVCSINRSDIARYYPLYVQEYKKDGVSFKDYVAENYGDMNDMCPSGGTYTYKELSDKKIIITCSEHGSNELKGEDAINAIAKLLSESPFKEYFAAKDNREINSEADASGQYAQTMNRLLKELGVDPDNASWKVEKVTANGQSKMIIYWTDTNIKNKNVGDTVDAIRCELKSDGTLGAVENGTATINKTKEGASKYYNILDQFKVK